MSEIKKEQLNNDLNCDISALPGQQMCGPSAEEMLSFMQAHGMIDVDSVANAMKKKEIENIINRNHKYAIFQDKDGRWKTYVKDETKKGGRRLVAKATQEKLMNALLEFYQKTDEIWVRENITLEQLYPEWIQHKRLYTKAENYITRIEREWKSYYEGTEITKIPIRNLTRLQLDEWAHALVKEHDMSNKQYYNCTVIMRQAMDYAVKLNLIPRNEFAEVKIDGRRLFRHVKKKESHTQVYSEQELKQIEELAWKDMSHCAKSRIHKLAPLAILFQFQTGIRIGEALSLRYEDISQDNKWVHIQRFYRYETDEIVEHTKGIEGDRFVPLTSHAREIIEAARQKQEELGLPKDGYIFSVNDKPLPYQPIQYLYEQYCKRLGIVQKSSHKSRKTYISTLYDAGVNINSIREFVGHADEQTTLHNYCYDRKSQQEKLDQIEKALAM